MVGLKKKSFIKGNSLVIIDAQNDSYQQCDENDQTKCDECEKPAATKKKKKTMMFKGLDQHQAAATSRQQERRQQQHRRCNCHEFIAYENLVSSRRGARSRRPAERPVSAQAPIDQVVPLVRRALKVLSDREVSPQLGLLKSTLLQLDSTFSERTYGVGSFRDFAQKLANAGHVRCASTGRNVLVELADGNGHLRSDDARARRTAGSRARTVGGARRARRPTRASRSRSTPPPPGGEPRAADGIRAVRRLFQAAQNPPRWPMYVRQAKQFMRNVDPTFDERKYGFGTCRICSAPASARVVPHRARSPGRDSPVPGQHHAAVDRRGRSR